MKVRQKSGRIVWARTDKGIKPELFDIAIVTPGTDDTLADGVSQSDAAFVQNYELKRHSTYKNGTVQSV
jgi:hypothetical protein